MLLPAGSDEVSSTSLDFAAPKPAHQDADAQTSEHAAGELSQFDLVQGIGAGALLRILWLRLVHRRQVLMAVGQPEAPLNPVQKMLVSLEDGVGAARNFARSVGPVGRATRRNASLGQPVDLSAFMACPLTRAGSAATRIVYAGELSPYSGVADFLSCAIAWAECHPDTPVSICWAGRGDLRGILQAQWVPSNLVQAFTDPATPDEFAQLFAHCGLLVVPSLSDLGLPPLAEAMAAGLPALGSVRSAEARRLVTPEVTGWLFDPLCPAAMSAALDAALTTPTARLAEMRMAARARVGAAQAKPGEGQTEEIGQEPQEWVPDLLIAGGTA